MALYLDRSELNEKESAIHLKANEGQENLTTPGETNGTQTTGGIPNEPDLGSTIRRLREERNLSLKEVAMRSDLTPSFLSQVERNLTSPSVASLRKSELARRGIRVEERIEEYGIIDSKPADMLSLEYGPASGWVSRSEEGD